MIRNTIGLAIICHCLVSSNDVFGDVPDKSPDTLSELATTIVIGQIANLEIKEERGRSGFIDLVYYTVKVSSVEKGRIQPGDQIVVRAWRWKERKRSYIGNNGRSPLPAVDEKVRVFLHGQSVEHPNGFAPTVALGIVTDKEFFDRQRTIEVTEQFQKLMVDGSDQTPPETKSNWLIVRMIELVALACVEFLAFRFRRIA